MFAWNGWALAPAVATAIGISDEHCEDVDEVAEEVDSSSDDVKRALGTDYELILERWTGVRLATHPHDVRTVCPRYKLSCNIRRELGRMFI